MRKKLINEYDGVLLGVDIVFYVIFIIIGSILLEFQYIDYVNATDFAVPIFYTLGFFSLLAYFINRKPDDYEFLFFGLINIITATYISNNCDYYSQYILGEAICVYTLAVALNKGFFTKGLIEKDNYDMFPKLISTILLTILGAFVSYHFIEGMTIESMLLGYYFIGFGLFGLLEPLLKIVIRTPEVKNYLDKVLANEIDVSKIKKTITRNRDKKSLENDIKKVEKKTKKEATKIKKEAESKISKVKKPIKKEITKINKKINKSKNK